MKKIMTMAWMLLIGSILMAADIDSARVSKDWNKLVDRVCCEYAKGYINSMLTQPNYQETARTFIDEAAPKMVNDKGEYITSDQLQSLLVEYGWNATATKLVQPLAERKTLDASKHTLNQLLDITPFSNAMQGYLSEAKTTLASTLATEYEKSDKPVVAQQASAIDSAMAEVEVLNAQASVGRNYDWVIFLLVLIVILEGIFLFRQTSRRRIVEVVKGSNMMHRTYVRKDDDDIAELRVNMARLQKRLDRIDPEGVAKDPESESETETPTTPLPDVEEGPITFKHL